MISFTVVLFGTTALRAQPHLFAIVMGRMLSFGLDLLLVTTREKECDRRQCYRERWKPRLLILLVDLDGLGGFLITLALSRGQEVVHRKQRTRQDTSLVFGKAGR